jgi:hypothetical protein
MEMRRAAFAGDTARADKIHARMQPTDTADPRHAAWYFDCRMRELDDLEAKGRRDYARRERAALAREFRAEVRAEDARTAFANMTPAEARALAAKMRAEDGS